MSQVSDFIIRLKNSTLAKRRVVVIPYSKLNKEVGKILVKELFLEDIKEDTQDGRKVLVARIRYEQRNPMITGVLTISKSSLRVYAKYGNLPKRRGSEVTIVSTSKGIMTGDQALKKSLGGEILFKIW